MHVVTVNDYLAKRDAEWMGKLYSFLGLSDGRRSSTSRATPRRSAPTAATSRYGQNNEFGFDYLRDNMKFSALDYAQRPLNYAIVDEVDSILIDEARTPLIISGPAEAPSDKYRIDQRDHPAPAQGRALQRRREGHSRHAHRRRRRARRRS